MRSPHIVEFSKLDREDVDLIGRKACQLAELIELDLPIPDGFVITRNASMPQDLKTEIHKAYRKLCKLFKEPSLNIFSSSPSNNKSTMFLNIKGDANLLIKIRQMWASHINEPVAIVVQKNISSRNNSAFATNNPTKEMEKIAKKIQKHFYFPQEVSYVIEKGKIYITAVKPFTGIIKEVSKVVPQKKTQKVLLKGTSINPGIVTGITRIINFNHKDKDFQIKRGEIAVVPHLNAKIYKKIKNAKAVVANEIMPRVYDNIIYRQRIGVPTIAGAANATRILRNGNIITVNGINGEIYAGGLI